MFPPRVHAEVQRSQRVVLPALHSALLSYLTPSHSRQARYPLKPAEVPQRTSFFPPTLRSVSSCPLSVLQKQSEDQSCSVNTRLQTEASVFTSYLMCETLYNQAAEDEDVLVN